MLRGVGMTPLGGLTPLKLTVFSRAISRLLIKMFLMQKLIFYQNQVNLQNFMLRGVGMTSLGASKTLEKRQFVLAEISPKKHIL